MSARIAVASVAMFLLTACGSSADPESGTAPATSPSTSPATSAAPSPTAQTTTASPTTPPAKSAKPVKPGLEVVVEQSDFGPILFDDSGQAIYIFDVETTTEPRCYGACAEAWPPVTTKGNPVAGRGIRAGLLGTTERTDGTTQVTYGGHPLYYYAHEGKREVKCHDVFLNGGNWYAVQANGRRA